jgi:hypothetical protein
MINFCSKIYIRFFILNMLFQYLKFKFQINKRQYTYVFSCIWIFTFISKYLKLNKSRKASIKACSSLWKSFKNFTLISSTVFKSIKSGFSFILYNFMLVYLELNQKTCWKLKRHILFLPHFLNILTGKFSIVYLFIKNKSFQL